MGNIIKIFLSVFAVFYSSPVVCQNPKLTFFKEAAGIGEDVKVCLVFDHPSQSDVFFPNQASYFMPFELKNITFFTTSTKDTISTDSVIYTLKSFEIDDKKYLRLPVWIVKGSDSTVFWSNQDSLFFKNQIPDSLLQITEMVDATPILDQQSGSEMSLLTKISLIGVLALGLIALVFQNKIRRKLLLFRFQKRQKKFSVRFRKIMLQSSSSETLNEVNSLWRNHMTWMENIPFNTLSSIEIEKAAKDKNVGEAIREIESSLFGGLSSERIPLALQILFSYAKERFRSKKLEYKKYLKKI